MTVCHKVVRSTEGGKLVNIATGDLKTESSYRVLPLGERILEFFVGVKKRQDRNRGGGVVIRTMQNTKIMSA